MQRASLTSGITARRSSASCSRSGKAEPAWPSDRTTWIWSEIANKLWDRCSWEKMPRSNMSSTKCSYYLWNTASLHVAPLGLSDAQQRRVQGRACHCAAQGRAVRTASKWSENSWSHPKRPQWCSQKYENAFWVCFLCMGLLVLCRSWKIHQFSAVKGILQKHKACICAAVPRPLSFLLAIPKVIGAKNA